MRPTALPALAGYLTMFGCAAWATGCYRYKEPAAEIPHALVIGAFMGGEVNPETGQLALGYAPGITVCKGKKPRGECKKEVRTMREGRMVKFRIPVGKDITIGPVGLVGIDRDQHGTSTVVTYTHCFGEPLTIVPQEGEVYEFAYLYDPAKQSCGAVWETSSSAP